LITMPEGSAVPLADSSEVKACCAAAYEQDWVRKLLGDSYHPGGPATTRRLADMVDVSPGMRVLDLASGTGDTALLLAAQYGADVTGIDRSAALTKHATGRALDACLANRVRFVVGDAESLPFASDAFDILICECAFCTFPDKATAALEMARVLRTGGRVAIGDITVDAPMFGYEFTSLAAWVSCIAGAQTMTGYCDLLAAAGLQVEDGEERREALLELLDRVEPRLLATAILRPPAFPVLDTAEVKKWVAVARQAVASGSVGYCLVSAQKHGHSGIRRAASGELS
jgi:arsenite methyltransferase